MSYTDEFYQAQAPGSRRSAERVAPIITDLLHPQSVVDVGCGVGTWLAVFGELGATDLLGFDGDYVDRSQLQIPEASFRSIDLHKAFQLPNQWPDRRFDLAVSLEVGEHLPKGDSESLVSVLVQLAPAVLFSAAIPHQGGTAHVNERWQDEWAELFGKAGYRPVDCVRAATWDDPQVEPWYAQNAFLYVDASVDLPETPALPMRLVHPGTHERRATPGSLPLREALSHVGPSTSMAIRRLRERLRS